ncbi:MAG: ribosomal RNA small subunit methyltransferase A [Desulfobacterales bacterium]|nr:ribosomal RNA small subunit methyltransferase A [Desulfobacterales bacterium]
MAKIEEGTQELAKPGSSITRNGLRPKKSLGQHFLADHGIIQEIIGLTGFQISDIVLEIGPGKGALTLPLARSVGHVVAVEKDTQLSNQKKKKLSDAGITNVTLVNKDILKFDFRDIPRPPSAKIHVIGNLPYNISSPFLEKLVENRPFVKRAVLMFQLEVALRLTASPGRKIYGAMTLLLQYYARATPLLEVPKKAFYPIPKVDSMLIELDFERPYPERAGCEDRLKKVIKGAFAHRRKTLLNSLKGHNPSWNREILLEAIEKCGIDPKRRAETLDMDEFLCLAANLKRANQGPRFSLT